MSFQNPLPPGIRQVVPDYVSDGVTTAYNFPFRLWAAQDLAVLVQAPGANAFSALGYGVGYNVAIVGNASATATLAAAPAAGALIRLMGLRTPARTTSVVNDGSVQSSALEGELDAVEATMQELRRDVTSAINAAQLAALVAPIASNLASYVTLRQVLSWAAANGVLYQIDNAVPADIANAVTIQWRRGLQMQVGDALYSFIEATLGWTSAQMTAAWSLMQGYAP